MARIKDIVTVLIFLKKVLEFVLGKYVDGLVFVKNSNLIIFL